MPPPPTDNLRVVKYAQGWGYGASEWERALGAIDWAKPYAEGGPERLKIKTLPDGTKDATVWRATLTLGKKQHDVVLKVEPIRSFGKKLQAWLHRTKAFRQFAGDAVLHSAGIASAKCFAVVRGRSDATDTEMLVLDAVRGLTVLELIGTPDELTAAALVGDHIRRMYEARLTNGDTKPSNLIVPNAGGQLVVVDTTDIAKGADLLSLAGMDEDDIPFMLRDLMLESLGTSRPPRVRSRAMALRALPADRELRRELWQRTADLIAAHGDPTPKDDPLARG
ncbi:MAG: hypothetical protein DHS20C14_22450 [Phycisphaeraceae bacterium]|nr:MAG: hypothetical protein DHS20C14_22450 [Phycisphaeraceae bacterium]